MMDAVIYGLYGLSLLFFILGAFSLKKAIYHKGRAEYHGRQVKAMTEFKKRLNGELKVSFPYTVAYYDVVANNMKAEGYEMDWYFESLRDKFIETERNIRRCHDR